MRTMAQMKTFTPEELFDVLTDCGRSLADAYEATSDEGFFFKSEQAFTACDYLKYVIQKQQMNQILH